MPITAAPGIRPHEYPLAEPGLHPPADARCTGKSLPAYPTGASGGPPGHGSLCFRIDAQYMVERRQDVLRRVRRGRWIPGERFCGTDDLAHLQAPARDQSESSAGKTSHIRLAIGLLRKVNMTCSFEQRAG